MKPDELREFLKGREVNFEQEEIQNGHLFRCESGEKFAVYNTGSVVCQGKPTALSRAVKEWKPTKTAQAKPKEQAVAVAAAGTDKPVFIVYGHDKTAREGLELVLHKMGLEPSNQFYVTLQAPPSSFPLSRVKINFDNMRQRLQLEILR